MSRFTTHVLVVSLKANIIPRTANIRMLLRRSFVKIKITKKQRGIIDVCQFERRGVISSRKEFVQ